MKKIYSITILLLFLTSAANAFTRYSVANNNWNNIATWSASSGGAGGASVPVAGDVVFIEGGHTVSITANAACASVDVASGATLAITASANTLTVSGNFSGSGTLTGGTAARVYNVGGDWTFSGTSGASLSLTLNGAGNQMLSGVITTVTANTPSLTINKASGTVTLGSNITLGATSTFKLTAGTFDASTFLLTAVTPTFTAGTMRVGATTWGGNYSFALTDPAAVTIEYYRAGAQTINGVPYSGTLLLSGSGAKTVATGTTVTVNGTLSMGGTATITKTGTGNFGYGAAGSLIYAGSAAQTTSIVEFPAAMSADVTINNGSGVTLDAAKTLSGNLTLTNGLLTTSATNLLTLAAGFSTSGASNSSFVNGPMAKAGTTAFTFPVGKSGAGLRTIGIGIPTASTTFNAEFFRADPHTAVGSALGVGITQISACEYWVLNRTVGLGNDIVIDSWAAGSTCNGASYVTNMGTLRVVRWTGALWEDRTNAGTTGTTTAGTITSNTVTSFSPFALGSSSSSSNPLPVKLSNIKAYEKQQGVQIDWTAYSEENLSRYTVERSADGINFSAIGDVASRNSATETTYGLFDANPFPGVNFYRLKNIDLDGKIGLSSIVRVNLDKNVKDIMVYPNPATGGYVSLQSANLAKGNYSVKIFNAGGQQVYNQRFTHSGGAINQTIQLPNGTHPGLYSIELDNEASKVMSKTFMVQ